jgi:hypothetical protein
MKRIDIHPAPVKDVKTFDGRSHEVDIRQVKKTFTAWAFVDRRMIEGQAAETQVKALANWKAAYKVTVSGAAE